MPEYGVNARRLDPHRSEATCKEARLIPDSDPDGRPDAFNPAKLFLAAVPACMIKNIERVAPMLRLEVRASRRASTACDRTVTKNCVRDLCTHRRHGGDDHKLELLHQNVRQYGTIYNTVAADTRLEGRIVRQ